MEESELIRLMAIGEGGIPATRLADIVEVAGKLFPTHAFDDDPWADFREGVQPMLRITEEDLQNAKHLVTANNTNDPYEFKKFGIYRSDNDHCYYTKMPMRWSTLPMTSTNTTWLYFNSTTDIIAAAEDYVSPPCAIDDYAAIAANAKKLGVKI